MSLAISKFKTVLSYQICLKSCKMYDLKFAFHDEHRVDKKGEEIDTKEGSRAPSISCHENLYSKCHIQIKLDTL